MEASSIITLAGMGVGVLVWALRVESRVTVLSSQFEALLGRLDRIEKLIDKRFAQLIDRK